MKTLIAVFALCFSINVAGEGLQTIDQEFILDDSSALEYGFPHEMYLKEIKVKPGLFGNSTVRMIGAANAEQEFDLVRVIKLRGSEGNQVVVEADVWQEHIGGESCDEEIIKKITLKFKVSREEPYNTSEHEFTAQRLHTPDNCHSPYSIREFFYSLMK